MTRQVTRTAALVALALPFGLSAQERPNLTVEDGVQVFGTVQDRRSGEPILAAGVTLVPSSPEGGVPWSGTSDGSGRFRTDILPIGEYELTIEVLSFATLSGSVVLEEPGVVDLRVEMVTVDYELDPVVAAARRRSRLDEVGFYQRRQLGTGHFVTRADLEDLAPTRISDVFRRIPGVIIEPGFGLMEDTVRLRGGCIPIVVLDGVRMANPIRLDDILNVMDIEALEVHQGPGATPIQYSGITTCGVVMVWSRDPVRQEGEGFSWGKLITAASFFSLFVLGPGGH